MGLSISVNKGIDLTKGEEKVLNALKKEYIGVRHDVVVYVQNTLSSKRPDFIIIDEKRGISILEVKDWTVDYIKEVNKRQVTLSDIECDSPNTQVIGYRDILSSAIFSRNFNIDSDDISMVVVYTNMDDIVQVNGKLNTLFSSKIKYLFKSNIVNLDIDKLYNNSLVSYSKEDFKKIRIALFPEIEIVNIENNFMQEYDIKALDLIQEDFAKKIPLGHYMVTGVPGSGKTVILLARAIHLIKENPNWKILILTYNKSLSYKLSSKLDKFAELFNNDLNNSEINIDKIEVRHFHGEIGRLTNAKKPNGMDTTIWFKEKVVELASKNAREKYDAILIDEYQDFYMNWIELCLKLCKTYIDKNGKAVKNIFLAGDRLQSIYNKNDVTWSSIGLEMRGGGRSKLLKTSYRSAKQHMSLALDFLKTNKTLKAEVEKFYTDDSDDTILDSLNNGSFEFIVGNYKYISDKIIELKKQGYKNEDFLILADNRKTCENIIDSSSEQIKYQMAFVKDVDSKNINNNIIVTTYHSSKGLESKIVFLTNMDNIYNGKEGNEQLKRKTVYVGITRASEKLYIHSKNNNSVLFNELKGISGGGAN